jgi:hypothetical protein
VGKQSGRQRRSSWWRVALDRVSCQAGLIRVSGLPFTLHGTEEMLLLLAGFRAERIIA